MYTAVKTWVQASRPQTLIVSISPVLIGATLAMSFGLFDATLFAFTLGSAFAIQIGTNFANDYFDFIKGADTENRAGPVRATQAGLVTVTAMKRAMIGMFTLAALLGLYLIWEGGFGFALLLALSIALGVLYTGGPAPLAYLGLADFFAFAFFGPIATCGTFYLQTHHFSAESLLVGFAPGAFSWAILTMNNLRDADEDALVNKRTLVVRFGRTFGKAMYISALLFAALFPALICENHPFTLIATLTFFPILFLLVSVMRAKTPSEFQRLFPKTAQMQIVYTFLFCVGWML